MKKVFVYGDSNVWGDNFLTGERIPDSQQWVNIVQKNLPSYRFLQEGLPGRLAGNDEKEKTYKNGKDTFVSTFRTNAPVDVVILALGTNDLQLKYHKSASKIIQDLCWYEDVISASFQDLEDRKKYFVSNKMPKIIYIMPPNFDYSLRAKGIFSKSSEEKRKKIISYFLEEKEFVIVPNEMPLFDDGIHLNHEGHQKMAKLVEDVLNDGESFC